MGKKLFIDRYKHCLSENISYSLEYPATVECVYCKHGPCGIDGEKASYDLTRHFVLIQEEVRDGDLIPDILLKTKSGDKIYVEIAVTHSSSEKKINSRERIIEITLFEEEDLSIFDGTKISFLDNAVELINFNPRLTQEELPNKCVKDISYFIVLNDGRCKIVTVDIYKLDQIKTNKNYIEIVEHPGRYSFIRAAERAFLKGVKIKNCFFCRYHAENSDSLYFTSNKPIFCKFLKSKKSSNDAVSCGAYYPDKKVFTTQQ